MHSSAWKEHSHEFAYGIVQGPGPIESETAGSPTPMRRSHHCILWCRIDMRVSGLRNTSQVSALAWMLSMAPRSVVISPSMVERDLLTSEAGLIELRVLTAPTARSINNRIESASGKDCVSWSSC